MTLLQPRERFVQTDGLNQLTKHSRRRIIPKGSTIFQTGDGADSLFYLVRGLVEIRQELDATSARDPKKFKDKGMTLRYIPSESFLGEVDFALSLQVRSHIAYTLEECEVCEVDYDVFGRLISQYPELLTKVQTQIAQQLLESDRKVLDVRYLEFYDKLRAELITLAKLQGIRHPNGLSIRIKVQDLAAKIGCSREMAGRIIKALSEEQFLSRNGYTLIIYERSLSL